MMTPLPCSVILQDQTVETSGCILLWSALEVPKVWKTRIPPSGRLVLSGPMARVISETLWGIIWEAHKPERGVIGRGIDFRTGGGQ